MAKAKSGAKKKANPAAKKVPSAKPNLLKKVASKAAKAIGKGSSKGITKTERASAKPGKASRAASEKSSSKVDQKAARREAVVMAAAKAKAGKSEQKPEAEAEKSSVKPAKSKEGKKSKATEAAPPPVAVEKPRPRATRLPPVGQPLTKREMEQLLTAGQGRGVVGEGSLKGRLTVKEDFPCLIVTGRDKRELTFVLQGPDQEVLPAYLDHKVSVSGLIRKTNNYGGTVDVRKYSAKKPEAEQAEQTQASEQAEQKLRYLSPGEVEQVSNSGMGAGIHGFATIRGTLEMTGEDFFLVVSNGGTRQQVSFLLAGEKAKGLRKHVGQTLQVAGVLIKTSGWGGRIEVENFEPRLTEFKAVSREAMELTEVEVTDLEGVETESIQAEVRLNQGLSVKLPERSGHIWAIEPTVAKRVGLREANFQAGQEVTSATREFFFTPRNPGSFEVEFFLAKAFTPAQVATTFKLQVAVKP